MTRPLRTATTGTLRARRWTTCQMAPGGAQGRRGAGGRGARARPVVSHLHIFPCLPHSSSPDEAEGKPKVPQQEDGPKGRCQLGTGCVGGPLGSPAHTVPRCG